MADTGGLVHAAVVADAAVAAIVGSKVYTDVAPDGTPAPYVVIRRVFGGRVAELDGHPGLENPNFQVDAYAATRAGARTLADAVIAILCSPSGLAAICTADSDDYDTEALLYRTMMEFSVWNTP